MNEQERRLAYALQGMSELARQDQYRMPATPAAGGLSYPLPQIEFKTDNLKTLPRISGSISTPLAGGELGVSGSYYQPRPTAPPDWSTALRYQRRF